MLQQEKPEDYVIGTGETHSVREFCEIAFAYAGMDYQDFVTQDQRLVRPTEVDLLIADPSQAHRFLNWQPTISFHELVEMMVDADIRKLREREPILSRL